MNLASGMEKFIIVWQKTSDWQFLWQHNQYSDGDLRSLRNWLQPCWPDQRPRSAALSQDSAHLSQWPIKVPTIISGYKLNHTLHWYLKTHSCIAIQLHMELTNFSPFCSFLPHKHSQSTAMNFIYKSPYNSQGKVRIRSKFIYSNNWCFSDPTFWHLKMPVNLQYRIRYKVYIVKNHIKWVCAGINVQWWELLHIGYDFIGKLKTSFLSLPIFQHLMNSVVYICNSGYSTRGRRRKGHGFRLGRKHLTPVQVRLLTRC